jgi:hypothetical protein
MVSTIALFGLLSAEATRDLMSMFVYAAVIFAAACVLVVIDKRWPRPPKPPRRREYRVSIEDEDGFPLMSSKLSVEETSRLLREMYRGKTI